MCEIQTSSPLASFLRTLNVSKSSITIVVDNARPTVSETDRILESSTRSGPQEEESSELPDQPNEPQRDNDVPATKRRKRRVSFNYKVRVVNCSALKNTEELFYSNQEYTKMRKEINATLFRLQQSEQESRNDDDCTDCCMRGLETFLKDAKIAKNRVRLHASLAVLTEQNRQNREEGNMTPLDSQEISRRYQRVSWESQQEARKRAMQDAVHSCSTALAFKTAKSSLGYDIGRISPRCRSVSSNAA